MALLLFVLLAATAVGASVAMVAHRSPVYSALYMVVTFAATAVMFLLLEAPFIAALQIIVYAGAVIVLFMFVIMFLNLKTEILIERRRGPLLLALVLAALVAGELAAVVTTGNFARDPQAPVAADFGSVESVASLLFTRYLVPFEITSLLLVVAMVGAVVLARRAGSGPAAAGRDDVSFAPPGAGEDWERRP